MMFRKFSALLVTIFLIISYKTNAQHNLPLEPNYFSVGLIGGANFLSHKARVPLIPGSDDCGIYENGESLGYYLGINADYSIINNFLTVGIRLSYDFRPAEFSTTTTGFQYYYNGSGKGEYRTLEILHSYNTSLTYLNFDIGFKILPIRTIPLFFRASFDAGNPIFNATYTNKMTLSSPESALFPNGKKEQIVENAELNNAGTAMGISGTFGYEIELNKDFYIAPEISYRYALNSVTSNFDWKTNIIRVGLNAFWAIPLTKKQKEVIKSEPEIKEEIKKEIIVKKEEVKKPVIKEKIIEPVDLVKQFKINNLNLTETIVTRTYPLLLYLFFNEKNATLPSKYINHIPVENFNEDKLPTNTLGIYYKVLDIIAKRMTQNPSTTITLTGTSDGRELPEKENRLMLALNRANNVKNYIVRKWHIAGERIRIQTQDIPNLPTSEAYEEGFEENRRVEITSNSPELLAPVIHSKFLEYTSTQHSVEAGIQTNDTTIAQWTFSLVDLNNNEIYKRNASGRPPHSLTIPVNKILVNEAAMIVTNNGTLNAKLIVKNEKGKTEIKQDKLNINLSKNQFEVGRLNLIVFDFDKYEISSLNKKLISEFIKSSIKENSTVNITGSTDKLGEAKYNRELSYNRANSVKNFLLKIKPDINIVSVEGEGPEKLKYNNNLPEGRFYCRTVMIEVKTPIGSVK